MKGHTENHAVVVRIIIERQTNRAKICVLGIGNYIRNTPSKSSTLHEHEMPFNEFHDVKALKNDYYNSLVIR